MTIKHLLLPLLGSTLFTACVMDSSEDSETSDESELLAAPSLDQDVDVVAPVPVGQMQLGQTCKPGNVAPQPLVCAPGLACKPDPFGLYGRCVLPPPPPPPPTDTDATPQ